jgi:site-specific recombinase XerD
MGAEEVNAFLSDLAVRRTVSASTQNQALSALLFLYRNVLQEALPWIDDIVRAQRPERLPVVLTIEEVRDVIARVPTPAKLVAQLLYGSGLRLLEALMLRIKDVDFARGQLAMRDPKCKHDRTTMLPAAVTAALHEQIVEARLIHEEDLVRSGCRRRLPRRSLPPPGTGGGNGSFRRRGGGDKKEDGKAAITCMRRSSSAP